MGRLTRRTPIIRHEADGATICREDALAVEEPLEVRVNGTSLSVTMRTPGDDFDLVAGFLVSEAVIWSAEQLASMRFCAGTDDEGMQTFNVIDASLSADTRPSDSGAGTFALPASTSGPEGAATEYARSAETGAGMQR